MRTGWHSGCSLSLAFFSPTVWQGTACGSCLPSTRSRDQCVGLKLCCSMSTVTCPESRLPERWVRRVPLGNAERQPSCRSKVPQTVAPGSPNSQTFQRDSEEKSRRSASETQNLSGTPRSDASLKGGLFNQAHRTKV